MLSRPHRFALLALAVIVLAVVGAGCGEQEGDPLSGASDADRAVTERAFKAQQTFSKATLRFAQAEGAQNLGGMRIASDRMTSAVRDTRDAALEIEDGELRRMLGDVAADQESITRLTDEYLTYLEDDTVVQDPAYEQQLYAQMTDASERANKSAMTMLNKMLDSASPEQRKRVSGAIRAYEEQIEAAYEK